jgi:methylmalonyl-CoA decarboxylase
MFFTAQAMPAQRALEVGLLNHLVPAEEIECFTRSMAVTIASLAPLSIAVIKEQIRLLCNARPLAPETFERIQGLRQVVYDSADYAEEIAAFLERRPARWTAT